MVSTFIDGRNRYKACQELGIEVISAEWNGEGSLVEFVAGLNLTRRNLNESQKAAVALDMLPMLESEAKERMRLGQLRGGEQFALGKSERGSGPSTAQSLPRKPKSTEQAANIMGVGQTTVTAAKRIAKVAPERLESIKQGKETVGSVTKDLKAKGIIKPYLAQSREGVSTLHRCPSLLRYRY